MYFYFDGSICKRSHKKSIFDEGTAYFWQINQNEVFNGTFIRSHIPANDTMIRKFTNSVYTRLEKQL